MINARALVEAENIKTVCAWCGKHMSGDPDAPDASHGQCPPCHDAAMREIDELYPDRTAREKLPEALVESEAVKALTHQGVEIEWSMFTDEPVWNLTSHKLFNRMAVAALAKVKQLKKKNPTASILAFPAPYHISLHVTSEGDGFEDGNDELHGVDLVDVLIPGHMIDYDV